MKKTLPLLLGLVVGAFALAEFYIPAAEVGHVQEELLDWAQILAAFAFVLGGVNILQVNYPKIRRREKDWGFKVVLLVGAVVMGIAGIKWQTFGSGQAPSGKVTVAAGGAGGAGGAAAASVVVRSNDDALVSIDGGKEHQVIAGAAPLVIAVAPGKHTVGVRRQLAGYSQYQAKFTVAAGQAARVQADLHVLWGPEGRVYTWMYDHIFAPCNATVFALLAFFIASAAFRAFRARNTESALLLGAAILVMLGVVPIGRAISHVLPSLSQWIVAVPNNAGRRAIMMGAALGAIVTSLRVILGLERSHLGSE